MPIEVPARFDSLTLYEVLGLTSSSSVTTSSLKKAYLKAALKFHPDHNKSPDANAEFAYLAKAHEILSDDKRRAIYDQTWNIEDCEASEDIYYDPDIDASSYWRSVFPKITKAQIDEYRDKYIGSEDEADDIERAYRKYEGDLNSVFESVPFADAESVERIAAVLNEKCRAKLTSKQIAKFKRKLASMEADEEKEFNELKATATKEQRLLIESAPDDMSALTNMINNRQKQRESDYSTLIESLKSKYVKQDEEQTKSRSKKSPRRTETEPTEEEFEKIQAKLMNKRRKN